MAGDRIDLRRTFDTAAELYDRARYFRRVRYDGPPPEPPLAPEAAAWVDAILREQGLRGISTSGG